MNCQDSYITINRSVSSRSGLYASDLPGVEDLVFSLTSKGTEVTIHDVWERIYGNAWTNLKSDLQQALQNKFFVNRRLISRETSEVKDSVNGSGELAGMSIKFDLPKFAKMHVLSVDVWVEEDYSSPELTIQIFHKDADGDLLFETSQAVTIGKNTIFIDQDFEVEHIFIAVDTALYQVKETQNKFYNTGYPQWDLIYCMYPCFGGYGYFKQVNGGGLNVTYDVYCSIEKYLCQNLNLYAKALWWRVGLELVIERRYGNRLNQFTTMTQERAEELTNFFNAQYQQALMNNVNSVNIKEDPFCFECNNPVGYKTILP